MAGEIACTATGTLIPIVSGLPARKYDQPAAFMALGLASREMTKAEGRIPMTPQKDPSRELLFGLVALQNGMIDQRNSPRRSTSASSSRLDRSSRRFSNWDRSSTNIAR